LPGPTTQPSRARWLVRQTLRSHPRASCRCPAMRARPTKGGHHHSRATTAFNEADARRASAGLAPCGGSGARFPTCVQPANTGRPSGAAGPRQVVSRHTSRVSAGRTPLAGGRTCKGKRSTSIATAQARRATLTRRCLPSSPSARIKAGRTQLQSNTPGREAMAPRFSCWASISGNDCLYAHGRFISFHCVPDLCRRNFTILD
jgi:hypothetical protein